MTGPACKRRIRCKTDEMVFEKPQGLIDVTQRKPATRPALRLAGLAVAAGLTAGPAASETLES
ncbi:hypothetical protein MKK68_24330, partial [Methylobacterium sp. E-016]|nr:hypothetical protein [Methylobacterium sp. E-016]